MLLTSANAARAIAQHARFAALKDLPVLAVGDSTADVARESGFGDVTSAAGDANALARVAAARFRGAQATLLYAAAEQRAVDLAEMLAPEGVRVRTTVVYRMAKQSVFPVDVAVALKAGTLDGVLHYSRRSAEAYLDCFVGTRRGCARAHALLSLGGCRRAAHRGRNRSDTHRVATGRAGALRSVNAGVSRQVAATASPQYAGRCSANRGAENVER